ncbi:hypothetical protein SHI21_13465 [Bacteriovorax sp. PP10]|uniref:DUF2628 domain-containing protein n=1 Tax=Bacteriovorax antarcticus TaxID=3088717 RepID=A0ABU5VX97_9BACT|nr:hypothetical protein [Bacteriovorax sp. PP10]MEA9357227.1 hypothetical protein [Bacteriovorax sp. PP10]
MVRFKHPNGFFKETPTGFSWTTLFFGFFVPLLRGWYIYSAICLIASVVTFGFSGLVFPFLINKHYAKYLLEQGYQPDSDQDKMQLQMMGIGFVDPVHNHSNVKREVA